MKPDFKNSIVNVSATLSAFLGNERNIPHIESLENELKKGYKNVVYICLDGLGIFPIEQNLGGDSFIRKNIVQTITSVFPSTTTNATSSLCSASYPMDHGMFGWSMYIDEWKRCVEVYTGRDSYTGEKVDNRHIAQLFGFEYYFDNAKNTPYETCGIYPPYVTHTKNNIVYEHKDEMFELIRQTCNSEGNHFIYSYCGEPDATMHDYGVTSEQAKKMISYLDGKLKELAASLSDTLIVVTPDHGQTDISEYIELYKDSKLLATLETPAYLEARAVSFRVKKGCEEEFKKQIGKYKQLKLYTVKDLIRNNYFGPQTSRAALLGDYIAVVKDTKTQVVFHEKSHRFKGHHTALTKREMLLPLIMIKCVK